MLAWLRDLTSRERRTMLISKPLERDSLLKGAPQ